MIRFLEPLYALLFIPLIVGLIFSWRHVHGITKGRKRIAFVLRGLLVSLVILALMSPQALQPNQGTATLFLVDGSDSVPESERKRAIEFVNDAMGNLGKDDQAGVIVFGSQAAVETAAGGKRRFTRIEAEVDPSATNLASAIRVASASFPDGKGRRIVILSDGNETTGDALQAAEVAASDGIVVDTVSLGQKRSRAEASVVELSAPNEQNADEPFDLRLVFESSVAQKGVLAIDRDGQVVQRIPVDLPQGRSSLVVSQKLDKPGFFRYRAYLQVPEDSDNRNNLGAAFVAVRGKPRVLVVQADTSKRELVTALQSQGIDVTLGGASSFPSRPEDLQAYDSLILNDFDASLTTPKQMEIVRSAVRDTGVGLVMIGGEGSFLPGGWYGTPVAEALPVDLNIRQRKTFPSTSVAIIVDTSGSMSMVEDGATKLQLAANAAVMTARLLSPRDRLAVAGSGSSVELVRPFGELDDIEAVTAQIRRLAPGGGGIFAQPSVAYAKDLLEKEQTKVRHFILLADGADCDQHGISLALANQMLRNKITVSTVAIGDGKDVPFLRSLAAAGGGRFYLADRANKLPQIFTQDVAIMSRSAIEEGAFLPKLFGGEPALRGITSTPALTAYCISEARPLARVGMKTHKDEPLLASWQYGLGRSVAFTSDAQNRWAKEWVGWDGFARFWAQTVRSSLRQAAQNDYEIAVTPEGGRGKIELTAKDRAGNPLASPEVEVRVSSPDGKAQNLVLAQEAPGVFSGNFDATELGSYIVGVVEPGPTGETRVATSGFSVPYPPEYRFARTNTSLLNGITTLTGGKELAGPKDALRSVAEPGKTISDLWPWLLGFALALLPLDIALRRLMIPLPAFLSRFSRAEETLRRETKSAPTEPRPMVSLKPKVPAGKEAGAASPEPSTVTTPAAPAKPVAPAAKVEGSVGSRLLAAKRQREESDSGDPEAKS